MQKPGPFFPPRNFFLHKPSGQLLRGQGGAWGTAIRWHNRCRNHQRRTPPVPLRAAHRTPHSHPDMRSAIRGESPVPRRQLSATCSAACAPETAFPPRERRSSLPPPRSRAHRRPQKPPRDDRCLHAPHERPRLAREGRGVLATPQVFVHHAPHLFGEGIPPESTSPHLRPGRPRQTAGVHIVRRDISCS